MKDEIKGIFVISNSPVRDMQEFIKYCKSYVDKCKYEKCEIYLKDGHILRFRSGYNVVGIVKYYSYSEVFQAYLKKYIIDSQEVINGLNNTIDELEKLIDNFDVFKVFTFPLMKRNEEQQVKSSIDYEWKKSIKEPFKNKLKKLEEKNNEKI